MFDPTLRQHIEYDEITRLCAVLTVGDRAELEAVAETNCAIKGATFIGKAHFESYRPLIAAGLIEWGPAPGNFSKRVFAGVTITPKGMAFRDWLEQERQT